MSRSFKKHPAMQDLSKGFRKHFNRKRKLREKQRFLQGHDVISDEMFERSIGMYSNEWLTFSKRK